MNNIELKEYTFTNKKNKEVKDAKRSQRKFMYK